MSEVSTEFIAKLRTLLTHITPGPWVSFVEGRDHTSGSNFIRTCGEDIELAGASDADQDFIARARQDVPMLLDEIERLRVLVASAQTVAE